jgi:diacylglycerol O-acyltransferase
VPPERLCALDASFLYLERPSTHMHVAALSVFDPSTRPDGGLRFEEVRSRVASRLHLAPRFRKKVLEVPMGIALPVLVDDTGFDLDRHVRRAALPPPGGRRELMELAQDLLSRPLDRSRPLWDLTVIEGLEGGHVATLMKVHHALMDGISGMQLASAMYDLEPDARPSPPPGPWRAEPPPEPRDLIASAMRERVERPLRAAAEAARALASAPVPAALGLGAAASGIRDIWDLGSRPASVFDVPVGPDRRFAITEAPFHLFRDVKESLGGTVNDVVLGVVAGALHRFLRGRRVPTRGRTLRVLVPVSVRSREDPFGNRVAPAFVDVPVGAMSPARRLALVAEATGRLKGSSMALGADAVIGLGAFAPAGLLAAAARIVSNAPWFNLVVSNVPGPLQPMYLAGARLVASYPSMPLGPTSALSIACTSLAGTMAFGLTADREAVPDLDALALALDASLAELCKAAGV